MKLFKSITALLMVAVLLFAFAGCASSGGGKSDKNKNETNKPNYDNLNPKEYFEALELNNADGLVDALTGVYGALAQSSNTANYATEMDISLQVGDMIQELLEENYYNMSGSNVDFSFLSKVNLEVDLNVKDKLQKMDMAVGLGNNRILTICTIMDLEDFTTWVGCPELSDIFAEMNLVESGQMGNMVANSGTMQSAAALVEAMPSEQEFNALIKRYLSVALGSLENVERKNITLELDGLQQECTVLTLKIYEEDALKMVKAVLNTAKTDSELEAIIDKFSVSFNALMKESYEQAGGKWYEMDLHSAFLEVIEDALASLEMEAEDLDRDEYIELVTYVDSDHNIIGRAVSVDETQMHYYTVTEGKTFAFEADFGEAKITGSGTNKSGKVDGTYKLNVEGSDLAEVTVEDWTAEGNKVKGRLVIEPSAELINDAFGNMGMLSFADIAVELKIDTDDNKSEFEINLLSNNAVVVGVAIGVKQSSSGGNIEKPSQTIDFNSQSQLQSWVMDMDFDKLIQNLRKAGVPSALLELLENNLF